MLGSQPRYVLFGGMTVGGSLLLGLSVTRPSVWPLIAAGVLTVGLLLLAALRPDFAVIALIAFPPGVLALVTSRFGMTVPWMVAVTFAAVLAYVVRRQGVGNRWLAMGYTFVLLLMASSFVRHDVANTVGSTISLVTFVYYGALYLLVLNVAPSKPQERLAYAERLQLAVLASVVATALIALAQVGPEFLRTLNVRLFPEDAGLLYHRTHFGYLMALGFAVALPRWVVGLGNKRLWLALTGATAAVVIISVTRGGWLSAALFVMAFALIYKRWSVLIAAPLVWLVGRIPGVASRLSSDFAGGAMLAVQSGVAGSSRLLLWAVLLPVALESPWFGNGFGFVSSLAPALYFGEGQFVSAQNPTVYAHNDALYLVLELGLIGLLAYAGGLTGWWAALVRGLRGTPLRSAYAPIVLTCLGFGIVQLISQSVDNGFFIKAVFERLVVVAATLSFVQLEKDGGDLDGEPEGVDSHPLVQSG